MIDSLYLHPLGPRGAQRHRHRELWRNCFVWWAKIQPRTEWRNSTLKGNEGKAVISRNSSANRSSPSPRQGLPQRSFARWHRECNDWHFFLSLFPCPPPDIPGLFLLCCPLCPNHWLVWERAERRAGMLSSEEPVVENVLSRELGCLFRKNKRFEGM